MRRLLLAGVIVLAATPAYAWSTDPTTTNVTNAGGVGGTATATQHQGQHQTATGGSVTINDPAGAGKANAP